MFSIVLLCRISGNRVHTQRDDLKSAPLDAAYHFSYNPALYAVWFDHNIRALQDLTLFCFSSCFASGLGPSDLAGYPANV